MNESLQSEKGLLQLVQYIKELNYKRHRMDIESTLNHPPPQQTEKKESIPSPLPPPSKKRKIQPRYHVSGYDTYKVTRHGKRPYCIVYLLDWHIKDNEKVIWSVEEVDQDDPCDDGWKDSVWKEEEKNLLKV